MTNRERLEAAEVVVSGYKCFGVEPERIPGIAPVNVVIGRNNTGKSALLDVVRYLTAPFELKAYSHKNSVVPSIAVSEPLNLGEIGRYFPKSHSGGGLPGNHFEYGRSFAGSRMTVDVPSAGRPQSWHIDAEYAPAAADYFERMAGGYKNPFTGMTYLGIDAERDIRPEVDSDDLQLRADGTGASNLVQRTLHQAGFPKDLVEVKMLADLNRILGPDGVYTRISSERLDDGRWGIVFHEEGKGRVSLADSGSGLKTVALVLVNLLVLPELRQLDRTKIVYGFEELENNLHPGLQRRLFKYVYETLIEHGSTAFITTHSPAVIDLFAERLDVQVLHVCSTSGASVVQKPVDDPAAWAVLDDLGVRASDLLQANGVVWVEGISDVYYVRRWIQLYCEEAGLEHPIEGSQFTFVEYGGRCLSHLDFSSRRDVPNSGLDVTALLPALALSRNSYLIMDSDKRGHSSRLNESKERAIKAVPRSWVTAGREIENYLPDAVAESVFGSKLGKYESAGERFEQLRGRRLKKKDAAAEAAGLLPNHSWIKFDGHDQIRQLVEEITRWNS